MPGVTKPALLLWPGRWSPWFGDVFDDRFDVLRFSEAEELEALLDTRSGDVVATLTNRLDAATIDRLPNLRLIAVPGAGYDAVDIAAARARGIRVANAGDTHSDAVAEHAVALALAAIHRLPEMHARVLDGRWAPAEPRRSVSAQRFGIVGLGSIGSAIARRIEPFGAEIAWWGPREKPEATWPRRESLLDLARWCTALVVSARGDAAGLVDGGTIDAVGPEGLIVNVSRGRVLDEDALIAALRDGRLGWAALDVFAEEPTPPERWRDVPNVVLTPHVSPSTYEATGQLREAAIRNLLSSLDGGPVVNEITCAQLA
jgi:hydroxypyruvate reductase